MPKWTPSREWEGQEAFIIGGGSSLLGFDFSRLGGKNTIGCNDAFRLGEGVVQICLFGDASWFHRVKWDLEKFKGRIVSCAPSLASINVPWLFQLDRIRDGIVPGGHLIGWNYSTGAAAINVAVSLGASTIYLLGFDLNRNPAGKSHWHGHRSKPTADSSFQRFHRGFMTIARSLAAFPGVRVLNVTDGSSNLTAFPRITFKEVFP